MSGALDASALRYRETLVRSLETSGVVGQVTARLRSQLISTLGRVAPPAPPAPERARRLADSLIVEHLRHRRLESSLAVFSPESCADEDVDRMRLIEVRLRGGEGVRRRWGCRCCLNCLSR